MTTKRAAALAALLFAVGIWGVNFVVVKIGVTGWRELPFVAVRFWVAALAFVPFISWKMFRSPTAKVENTALLKTGVLAGICLFVAYILQAFALGKSTASKAAFLTALFVVFVPLIQVLMFKRRPLRREVLACIIAWIGVGFLVNLSISTINGSDILLVGSAFFYAFQIVTVGSSNISSRSIDFTAIQLVTVAIAATLASLPDVLSGNLPFPSTRVVVAIIFTGIVASALAYFLQAFAQRQLTPPQAAVIFTFEPIFAAFAGIVFMKESLTAHTLTGGALIVFATVICTFPIVTRSKT